MSETLKDGGGWGGEFYSHLGMVHTAASSHAHPLPMKWPPFHASNSEKEKHSLDYLKAN